MDKGHDSSLMAMLLMDKLLGHTKKTNCSLILNCFYLLDDRQLKAHVYGCKYVGIWQQ